MLMGLPPQQIRDHHRRHADQAKGVLKPISSKVNHRLRCFSVGESLRSPAWSCQASWSRFSGVPVLAVQLSFALPHELLSVDAVVRCTLVDHTGIREKRGVYRPIVQPTPVLLEKGLSSDDKIVRRIIEKRDVLCEFLAQRAEGCRVHGFSP